MRLFNTYTLSFAQFQDRDVPPYVIAPHRWTDEEVTFEDFIRKRNTESLGHKNILGFRSFLNRRNESLRMDCYGYPKILPEWLWIDTGCINNRISAEISEAINCMYRWYSEAYDCIAYLADVEELRWDKIGKSVW